MIKLHYLEVADPLLNFGIRAGFTHNGKRYTSLITNQNGTRYVRSGAAITHNLALHRLSDTQSAAVDAFCAGSDYAVEYPAPIL